MATFTEFLWVYIVEGPNITHLFIIYRRSNFGDLHQFISHCLTPLDPCKKLHLIDTQIKQVFVNYRTSNKSCNDWHSNAILIMLWNAFLGDGQTYRQTDAHYILASIPILIILPIELLLLIYLNFATDFNHDTHY